MRKEIGLKKIIRYFRMLKLFTIIATWFEKFTTFMKWFAGHGKFYFKVFDTFRGTASFLFLNSDKISALVKGTVQVSASIFDHTIFVAMLLNALSKPVYSLYFAYQGMLEDKTKAEAMNEFRYNRKALANFLLGSAAMEGNIGYVIPHWYLLYATHCTSTQPQYSRGIVGLRGWMEWIKACRYCF